MQGRGDTGAEGAARRRVPAHKFDPQRITTEALVNDDVTIRRFGYDPAIEGTTPFNALGANSLRALADELGISVVRELSASRALAQLHDGGSLAERKKAAHVFHRYGQRVGAFIATLQHPETQATPGFSTWTRSYLQRWSDVRRIWLGGGIVSSSAGPSIARSAQAAARNLSGNMVDVRVAEHPHALPIIGAARTLPRRYGIVVDFGGSAVKRALASRDQSGRLQSVTMLPEIPVANLGVESTAEDVKSFMAAVVGTTLHGFVSEGMLGPDNDVAVSVAAYAPDGFIASRKGRYGIAHGFGSHDLSARMQSQYGLRPKVEVMHDGTAAARALDGTSQDVVLMLGTAVGVGFPPEPGRYRPLSPDFHLFHSNAAMEFDRDTDSLPSITRQLTDGVFGN